MGLSTDWDELEEEQEIVDKTLLLDADTIVYATAVTTEEQEELLPKEFYTPEQWEEIVNDPNYDESGMLYTIDLELALQKVIDSIEYHTQATDCSDWEAHFTTGHSNFRYQLSEVYKGNRTGRVPLGNKELKLLLKEKYPDKVYLWDTIEADDAVVHLYDPNKHILGAVDKDVLNNVAGNHWNYYSSRKHNIDPKWVEISEEGLYKYKYKQTLTGDKQDNIIGLHRVGDKTADKLLAECTTEKECWDVVVREYKKRHRTEEDALLNMRLVNMRQWNGEEVILWDPPK